MKTFNLFALLGLALSAGVAQAEHCQGYISVPGNQNVSGVYTVSTKIIGNSVTGSVNLRSNSGLNLTTGLRCTVPPDADFYNCQSTNGVSYLDITIHYGTKADISAANASLGSLFLGTISCR